MPLSISFLVRSILDVPVQLSPPKNEKLYYDPPDCLVFLVDLLPSPSFHSSVDLALVVVVVAGGQYRQLPAVRHEVWRNHHLLFYPPYLLHHRQVVESFHRRRHPFSNL